jgi:hypothetical protein
MQYVTKTLPHIAGYISGSPFEGENTATLLPGVPLADTRMKRKEG